MRRLLVVWVLVNVAFVVSDWREPFAVAQVVSVEEICNDGISNDCDSLVDCQDPDCVQSGFCEGESPQDNCADGRDNDGDGRVDCDDCDCRDEFSCLPSPECFYTCEVCDDGIDNDGDGLVDCDDTDCCSPVVGGFVYPACHCPQEDCSDGEDNNFDGLADCNDPVCAEFCGDLVEDCSTPGDEDLDGHPDCADTDCETACVCLGNCTQFLRGDANDDAQVDIADAVWTIDAVFNTRSASTCADATDANDDGLVNVSDTVFLITYQFLGGPQPPPPFPECGSDDTDDSSSCLEAPSTCAFGG